VSHLKIWNMKQVFWEVSVKVFADVLVEMLILHIKAFLIILGVHDLYISRGMIYRWVRHCILAGLDALFVLLCLCLETPL